MNAKLNLKRIKDCEYDYIVGSRLKNLGKKLKEVIFNKDGYNNIEADSGKFKYKILKHKFTIIKDGEKVTLSDQIIVTWSSKRAAKDRKDRARLIKKAGDLVKNPSAIKTGKGAKKYVKISFDKNVILNTEKIKEDEKWDGFYGVQTSSETLTPKDVIENYHHLWKIEESFRELKSHFETRPVFHWTPERIKGHLVICFIAFLLSRTLELRLKKDEISCSCSTIRDALNSLELSELKIKDKSYYLKSCSDALSKKILRVMRIKVPKNLTLKGKFIM